MATNDHKRWCTSNASGKGKGGCGKGNNDVMVRVYPAMARVVQPRVEDDDDNNDDDSGNSKGMGTIKVQRVQNPRAQRAKEKALKVQNTRAKETSQRVQNPSTRTRVALWPRLAVMLQWVMITI